MLVKSNASIKQLNTDRESHCRGFMATSLKLGGRSRLRVN